MGECADCRKLAHEPKAYLGHTGHIVNGNTEKNPYVVTAKVHLRIVFML